MPVYPGADGSVALSWERPWEAIGRIAVMTVSSSIRVAELSVLLFVLSRVPLLRLWVKLVVIIDDSSF